MKYVIPSNLARSTERTLVVSERFHPEECHDNNRVGDDASTPYNGNTKISSHTCQLPYKKSILLRLGIQT